MSAPDGPMENGGSVKELLAAAAEWRLIAVLLARPRSGWREEISQLARETDEPALRSAAIEAAHASEGAYLGVVGPGAPVSPREVAYREREDPGWVLADVSRYYDAFAFQPRTEDPLDHVAVEADFVGYLFLKEAFARAGGEEGAAALTATVREDFLRYHLAAIAAPFAERTAALALQHLATTARALAKRVPPPVPGTAGFAGVSHEPDDSACGSCVVPSDPA